VAIEQRFNVKTELIKSKGGAFEVFVNGQKKFSKLKSHYFPEIEEIFNIIDKEIM